jgi:alginate O-acetyltransferase complex protein AlgI
MLFHTPEFIFFFLVFLLCYLPFRGGSGRVWVIVIASQIFYAAWDFRFLPLLWFTMLTDFVVARGIAATQDRARRRLLLLVSVGLNMAVLAFFKYWNLVAGALGGWLVSDDKFFTVAGLVLPIGVSFYTFQCLSYVVDVYRGQCRPVKSLRDYAAFVTYFPQLVMGPIERMGHLLPQILKPAPFSVQRASSGLLLFAIGFFRKGAGDALGSISGPVFANIQAETPAIAVTALLSFWLQVYLDFSGYTDMARGISRIIGIELSLNFRMPYFATSMQDFWRRWHITLSTWLRDYVYVPLGGNRFGRWITTRNLYITMVLSACWHGGGWNFLIFGLLHGTYLTVASLFSRTRLSRALNNPEHVVRARMWKLCGWAATMSAFIYSLVYFRSGSFQDAMVLNGKLLDWLCSPSALSFAPSVLLLLIPVVCLEALQLRKLETGDVDREISVASLAVKGTCIGLLLLYGFILFAGSPTDPFIYFQF